MKTSLRLLAALGALSALATTSSAAHALVPVDLEVGPKVGVATNPFGSDPINPLGVGIGGRAGVTLLGFYGGVNFLDYLGGSQEGVSESALQYGLELGYTVKYGLLRIRPQLGFGDVTFSTTGGAPSAMTPNQQSSFYLEPGLTVLVVSGFFFFGADANALGITSPILLPQPPDSTLPPGACTPSGACSGAGDPGPNVGFTAHAQVGLTF